MAGSGAYYLEDMEGKTASPALECEQFEKKNTTTKCNHYDGMSYTVHFFGGNGTKMIVFFNIKLH